jgi:peptidoglycan/xylan/chitin deacetylase (PgdA/CDA1 family)
MFAAARWVDENRERVDALQAQHRAARARVPDVASVRNRLAEIGATNQRVRDNQRYEEKAQQAAALAERIDALHARIQEIDAQRAAAIAAARWPVPGLGWTPEGVTLNGVPFEQASSSEQLRAGVAIGLALNPKLQVLLVRNGNLLDEDGVRALAEQAEAAGAQVWMEYVTSGSDGVTVLIEDGHVG